MTELAGEVIKLSDIREVAKRELQNLMDNAVTGGDKTKCVVIDPALIGPFKYTGITTEAFKRERGVVQLFPLQEKTEMPQGARNVVFFVRASVELMRRVAAHAIAVATRAPNTSFFIYFVPKKTLIAHHILDNEYQLSEKVKSVAYGEFDLDLIPMDDDIMSMEMRNCFKEVFLDGDFAVLHTVARAIMKLQTGFFGPIPQIRAKGKYAFKVLQILKRLANEVGAEFTAENLPEIESMVIVDRSIDMVTPMMTQLTYEGLIEELYGIETTNFSPPFEVAPPQQGEEAPAQPQSKTIPLNAGDRMFSDIRDRNFATVASVLHQKSLWVKQSYERRKEVQQLKDLREFMKGLPEMQEMHRLIGVHTNIAAAIGKRTQSVDFRKQISIEQNILLQTDEKQSTEYIEDLINKGDSLKKVLRLLCLLSIVNNGLKPKVYDAFKESLMLTYGIPQMIVALQNLDRAGLLTKNESRGNWSAMRDSCKIYVPGLDEKDPKDIAYTYSGYAPILARAVEAMTDPSGQGWRGGMLDAIPGEKGEILTDAEVAGSNRVILVIVIGGITHAEIAALRFMASRSDGDRPRHFVIATTNITSGKKTLETLLPFANT